MADLDRLLERTSRTFALAIPRLPAPTRREVTVAYLLFRIADTFEDTTRWEEERRIGALADFCRLIAAEEPLADEGALCQSWSREVPLDHDGYRELLGETPFVMEAFRGLGEGARREIRSHLTRTAHGMAGYVSRTGEDGHLRLRDLADLRDYCYTVAGIVGEMLTELYLLDRDELVPVASGLRERAVAFGEGLQLVNILKDSETDRVQGRVYLPEGVERAEVLALARRDLERAAEYILTLQRAGAEKGLVAFNALPVHLALATLDVVERKGPGSKISRPKVWSLVAGVEKALAEGRPVIQIPA